ncbi:MAG: endopeptidase La [Anaerolineaceae bacterium]|nr:endopeptidase La [Anaerolineaceae bacterium]
MKYDDSFPGEADEGRLPSILQQRTEELYNIPDTEVDQDGVIIAPAIIFREVVVFPRMISPIFVVPGQNLFAIQEAQHNFQTAIGLVVTNPEVDIPDKDSLLSIGIEVAVGRLLGMPDGNSSALVQGRRRVEIIEVLQTDPYYMVKVRPIEDPIETDRNLDAIMRSVKDLFDRCVQHNRSLPDEAYLYSMNINEPGWLADMIATAISLPFEDRLILLSTTDVEERLKNINWLLAKELDVLELEKEIQTRVQSEVDRSQREHYLREQMRAIQKELGEEDIWMKEIGELSAKIAALKLPAEAKQAAERELERLGQVSSFAPEVGIIRAYLDWIIALPWKKYTRDVLDVKNAAEILDRDHYGLKKVKDRILEHIAVQSLKPKEERQPILCFVGPPGTGKTSIGKSIAEAMKKQFVRLSLGGVRDEAEIRGHRRTYIGALPGRILQTMRRADSRNPLFMLDEIDKLGNDYRGDPASALLEVLDPEQNNAFSDHYLEVPFDLSKVMFITTANQLGTIPAALLDRMEIVEFSGYTEEEKIRIAKEHLLPRQIVRNGLLEGEVQFMDSAISKLIHEYTYEAGVRNLEREIGNVCRKIARRKAEKKSTVHRISPELVEKLLGPQQVFQAKAEMEDEVGVATAIAWTENGGDIMPIEVLVYEGKGNIQITGQIGDIMQESAQAAFSYIKYIADDFDIEAARFENIDLHLHVPEGAIPKDGPSAGITIATAILSALTERKIKKQIGMTGEITLRGNILPIGGVKEKVLAAHRGGIKTILLPDKNKKELIDIPKKILSDIDVRFVSHVDEVFEYALLPDEKPKRKKSKPKDEKKPE